MNFGRDAIGALLVVVVFVALWLLSRAVIAAFVLLAAAGAGLWLLSKPWAVRLRGRIRIWRKK